jgi:RNA polymerase sigma factor (sigma-70 family)
LVGNQVSADLGNGSLEKAGGLLDRCRAGDPVAWSELVTRYQRLVFTVALRNGLSREDAADVTQTTFVHLLRSIDSIQHDGRIASWLMTVARRQAWQVARQRSASNTAEIPEHLATPDTTAAWERAAVLYESVERLGEPCGGLLYSLYLDPTSPSYAEIARRLGRRIGGIGPLRARCLERLRAMLGDSFD